MWIENFKKDPLALQIYAYTVFSTWTISHTIRELLEKFTDTVFTEKPPCTLKDDLRFIK